VKVFALIFLLGVIAQTMMARSVELAWEPSSDNDLAGYRLYFGTASNVYSYSLDLGDLTNTMIKGLDNDASYFFIITAYTTTGAESLPSNEIVSPLILPPAPVPITGRLLNLSVRGFVQSDDDVMIGGFMIAGSSDKKLILRALGPSLANSGIKDFMVDPVLELHDASGAIIGLNSGWTSDEDNVLATGLPPTDSREAALVVTLPPGAYSVILKSATNASNTALFEVYDLDPAGPSELVNISTRGRTEVGDHVIIGGFIIGGLLPANIVMRAIGPSLQPMVSDILLDPVLSLHDINGALLVENNNWADYQAPQLIASGIPPNNPSESAIIEALPSGGYSGVVQGVNETSGNALIEIYNLGLVTDLP
jgi:hypothetical protein